MTRPRIRVLLCDDVAAFRSLLRWALTEDPGIDVVGEASDGLEGIQAAAELKPDVVVIDMAMPHMDGLEAIPHILERAPGARIVVLSGFDGERMAPGVIDRGAVAYLEKGMELGAIREAVLRAAA